MPRTSVREVAAKRLIGARIRAARKQAGLSQAALATRLGIGQGVVSDWEAGQRRVGYDELWTLAKLLGVAVEALIGEPVTPTDTQFFDAEVQRIEARRRKPEPDEDD